MTAVSLMLGLGSTTGSAAGKDLRVAESNVEVKTPDGACPDSRLNTDAVPMSHVASFAIFS